MPLVGLLHRFAVAALGCCLAAGCEEQIPLPTGDMAKHVAAETLDIRFEELYPTFLYRRSMSQGDKSNQWSKYRDHWVRWEGVITSITNKGVTFKHLRQTVTFDVSLTCEANALKIAKERYAPGDRVRYVGMLSTFDDIFRTMYLTHGAVIEKVPHGDLGVIADMSIPTAR
jgi:hypothetical protein